MHFKIETIKLLSVRTSLRNFFNPVGISPLVGSAPKGI